MRPSSVVVPRGYIQSNDEPEEDEMPKKITVTPKPGGKGWNLKPSGGAKAPDTTFQTQKRAATVGKSNLRGQGGGELAIKNVKGQVRDQNTVPPARDPRRSKG